MTMQIYGGGSIEVQLSSVNVKQREEARRCRFRIIGAVQMLDKQGLPFRGHNSEGNVEQVLKYKSNLTKWLTGGKKDLYSSAVVLISFTSLFIQVTHENISSFPHLQL